MDPLLAELIGAEEGESVEAFIARELGEANRKRNRNGRPGPPDRHGRSDQSSEGETRRATESHGKD